MWEWLSNLFSGAGGNLGATGGSLSDILRSGAGTADALGEGAVSGVGGSAASLAPDVASAAGGAGGGLADLASRLAGGVGAGVTGLGQFAKGLLPVAQLGATGLGVANSLQAQKLAREQNEIARNAQRMQEESVAPLRTFGTKELALAQGGQLPEAEEARITEWINAAKQRVNDFYSRAGQGTSTSLTDALANVDRQAVAMRQNAIDAMKRGGTAALASAASGASDLSKGATQQAGSIEALIGQANQALAKMLGGTA